MARKVMVEIVGNADSLERSFRQASKSTQNFERGLGRSSRGALAAAVSFRGLGRSIAFASSSFIGVYGLSAALRDSVVAAESSVKAHASLAAALHQIGQTTRGALPEVDRWAKSQARFGVSANDAIKGLSRLVIITGSVRKAMAGYTAALEISKATGKSLQAVQLAVAKALNGQTTALARYIGKIPKGITAWELLARVQAKFAGQAAANTDATDKLHAAVINLETAVGKALHPTVERLAGQLTKWLENSRNQLRVQHDVTKAVADLTAVLKDAKGVIEGVDKVTGSFKNTLELLIGLRLAVAVRGWMTSFGLLGGSAATAEGEIVALRTSLVGLSSLVIPAIVIPIEYQFAKSKYNPLRGPSKRLGTAAAGPALQTLDPNVRSELRMAEKMIRAGKTDEQIAKMLAVGSTIPLVQQSDYFKHLIAAAHAAESGAATRPLGGPDFRNADLGKPISVTPPKGVKLTAAQRNTFFDNAIARILLRGGLGNLKQQLAAMQQASALITARLKVTKDITRKLNLEDQLLQIRSQEAGVRQQMRQARQQAAQDRLTKISAREFFTLGLGPTGDTRVPLAATLRKRLGTLSQAVKGTFLDTDKTRKQLAGIRKVLSEAIVPSDVRAKIRDLLDQIRQDLNKGLVGNQTRFAHISTERLLAGVTGLTPQQRRQLQARLAQIGVHGTVPGSRSAAFAGAGANNPVVVHTTVNLDGKKVAENTTKHQRRKATHRSDSRRGPYAGRN